MSFWKTQKKAFHLALTKRRELAVTSTIEGVFWLYVFGVFSFISWFSGPLLDKLVALRSSSPGVIDEQFVAQNGTLLSSLLVKMVLTGILGVFLIFLGYVASRIFIWNMLSKKKPLMSDFWRFPFGIIIVVVSLFMVMMIFGFLSGLISPGSAQTIAGLLSSVALLIALHYLMGLYYNFSRQKKLWKSFALAYKEMIRNVHYYLPFYGALLVLGLLLSALYIYLPKGIVATSTALVIDLAYVGVLRIGVASIIECREKKK